MPVPAGVQNQDVAFADVGARALDDLRRDHRPVVHVLGDVDDDAAVDQIVERQMRHVALRIVGRVHGAVEMGADMQRGVDALRDDADRLQVLRVIHLVAGIADPAGRVHVHDVGQIDDFHRFTFSRSAGALRLCVVLRKSAGRHQPGAHDCALTHSERLLAYKQSFRRGNGA